MVKVTEDDGILKGTIDHALILEAGDSQNLTWYMDASFPVQSGINSHSGAEFILGKELTSINFTKP